MHHESSELLLGERLRKPVKDCAAATTSAATEASSSTVHRSAALDFPRFLAAIHVATYHAWTSTSVPRSELPNFLLWGYTWVPFFFLLSGFVLFFSKAQAEGSSEVEASKFGFAGRGRAWLWLWKRWISMYPLFVLSLVLGLWGVPFFAHPEGMWMALVNMLLMLQAWAWELRCTEHVALCAYSVWNEPAWFVSALFFCWLTFPLAYRQLHRMGGCACAALASGLYAVSFWELVTWRNLSFEQLQHAEQIGAIASRNPITNLNKFLLGAVLARLVLLRCHVSAPDQGRVLQMQRLPCCIAYAATPASTALLVCFVRLNPDTTEGREAIIVGLFGLLICSLAAGRDPLAQVLGLPCLAWWGKFSYGIYILHNAVLAFTSQLTMNEGYTLNANARNAAFFPVLFAFVLLGHYGVELPTAAFYKSPPAWLCGGCCARTPRAEKRAVVGEVQR